jgi:AGCS family alanine or glycine:cation symporter
MKYQTMYKLLALMMLFVGGMGSYVAVWAMSDVGIALMTVFNVIAIVPMCGEALALLKDFEAKRKAPQETE